MPGPLRQGRVLGGGGSSWRRAFLPDSPCDSPLNLRGRYIPEDHLRADGREGQKEIGKKKKKIQSYLKPRIIASSTLMPSGSWELGSWISESLAEISFPKHST